MLKKLYNDIKNIDKKIFDIMFAGFKFSFMFFIVSCIISITYMLYPVSHILYYSGIILFKTGLTFVSMFFVCGFAMNKIIYNS